MKHKTGPQHEDERAARIDLPLGPTVQRLSAGWEVRIPVRAEHIRVDRRTIVREEIRIKTWPAIELVRLDDTVQREVADLDVEGGVALHQDPSPAPVTDPTSTPPRPRPASRPATGSKRARPRSRQW